MAALKGANLAVKFALELVAIGAFAYWGSRVDGTVVAFVAGIGAPLAAVVVWGLFAAPRASRRLPTPQRVPLELGVFALATVALVAAGLTAVGIAFAAVVVVNFALLVVLDQLEG